MTPLPKRRLSRRRQGKRRASIKIKLGSLVKCPNCQKLKSPHLVCRNCGQYNNRQIIVKKEKKKEKN